MVARRIVMGLIGEEEFQVKDIAVKVINCPDLVFKFSSRDDKARVRRQVEEALRIKATDREILVLAARYGIRL